MDKTLESAKLQYDNAVIAKNNTYTNTEKQLELAKAQLDATSTQNQGATNPSNTSLDLSTKSLENARLSLENFNTNSQETLKSLETKRNSILSSLRVTIEGSFISFETSLRAIDEILGVTDLNRALNDSFEMYLSAKNSNYKNESETLFTQNNAEFLKLRSEYRTNFNEDELIAFYDRVVKLANDNATLLDKMVLVLNNTVESASFGDSAINYAKSGFVTFQTQFSTLKGNLNSLYNSYFDTINTISSTKTNLDTQKSSLEQAVKLAEATYNNTKANVSNTENTTKIQYETTVESVRAARETADNNLKMALNQYNSARANYDSQLTQLKAQIDGTS
ncbi:MAG: hypothetical protein LBF15_04545 [Candidatus Peribacteria bacterium]|nr:hypothetical protein [Candidatus Peribacteria bacterium]